MTPIHPYVPQTEDALPVEIQRLDRDHVLHRMGLHGHTFFELILIEQAGGAHRVGTEVYATHPGSLFVIAPGELHDCSQIGEATGWVLLFTHEMLEGVFSASRAYVPQWPSHHPLLSPFLAVSHRRPVSIAIPAEDQPRWFERFRAMAREMEVRSAGYRHGLQAHFTLVLLDLLRLSGSFQEKDAGLASDSILSTAFAFIDRAYHRPISTQDVAREAGRSSAHLTTSMRVRTGLTVGEWITERRMAEGRRLLASTLLDLHTIADRSGYSDADAFARAFRRTHGLTPVAWRQAHHGQPPYT